MKPSDIKQILLVAGLSGSGKSTFMRALAEGTLPGDVMHCIPEDAERWPHTSCKFLLEHGLGGLPAGGEASGGLVIHYNMSRPFAFGLPDYLADEGLKMLDRLDARIDVITIVAERDTLIDHIRRRATDPEWIAEDLDGSPMLRKMRRRLRAVLYNAAGMGNRAIKPGQRQLICHYESAGSIEHWLDCWADYLGHLRRAHRETRFTYVAPHTLTNDNPNFRLIDKG